MLFGREKKILSCNFWFAGWLAGITRVYFFVSGLFISQTMSVDLQLLQVPQSCQDAVAQILFAGL